VNARFAAALLFATTTLTPAPLPACGPYVPAAIFWYTHRTNEPLTRFLDGHLGILDPELERPYLFVAYRHLTGLGLDPASREALQRWLEPADGLPPDDSGSAAIRRWRSARRAALGALDDPGIRPFTRVTHEHDGTLVHFYYRNCLDDAFETATRTALQRLADLGAGSTELLEWGRAQDRVFANCNGPATIPDELPPAASSAARADRAYQIAAAAFYAGRFDEAEQRFRAIAADPASPWRATAALLVARTLIRRGMLSLPIDGDALAAAEAELSRIETEPSLAAVHASAARLRSYVGFHAHPGRQRVLLAGVLGGVALPPDPVLPLIDYAKLAGLDRDEDSPFDCFLSPSRCAARASTSLPPPLGAVLAAMLGRAPAAPVPDAMAAAQPTLDFGRARALARAGHDDEARAVLDGLLRGNAGPLAPGDRNRVLSARAELATDLAEYLRLSQMAPVAYVLDAGPLPLAPEDRQITLTDSTYAVIAGEFDPGLQRRALDSGELVDAVARRVAVFSWMRANLAGDEIAARELAEPLARLVPEMAPEVDAWRRARGKERRFAFALTALRFPGARPAPGGAFPRTAGLRERDWLRDNWWCRLDAPQVTAPRFIDPATRARAAAMRARLAEVEPVTESLSPIVFSWATSHPRDPRVPEALHRLVTATRYSACAVEVGLVSKRAFRWLHRRYPESPWTARTPYWFGRG